MVRFKRKAGKEIKVGDTIWKGVYMTVFDIVKTNSGILGFGDFKTNTLVVCDKNQMILVVK